MLIIFSIKGDWLCNISTFQNIWEMQWLHIQKKIDFKTDNYVNIPFEDLQRGQFSIDVFNSLMKKKSGDDYDYFLIRIEDEELANELIGVISE